MNDFSLRLSGFSKATANVRAAILGGVDRGLDVAGARGEELVKTNINSPFLGRGPAVAFGTLVNSIAFERSTVQDLSRVEVKALPPADQYAAYVETGTGPHFPPVAPLTLWVKQKFHVNDEQQAKNLALLIARKIARRGTSGFGMFARAFRVLQTELNGIFKAAIGQEILKLNLGKK